MKAIPFPKAESSERDGVPDHAARLRGAKADYPWQTLSGYPVRCHLASGKWIGADYGRAPGQTGDARSRHLPHRPVCLPEEEHHES